MRKLIEFTVGLALIAAAFVLLLCAPARASQVQVGPNLAPAASTTAEACHVFKASPGTLYSASGYIGAAGFIMVFDAASAPADGAVTPKTVGYAATAGSWSITYAPAGAVMGNGITICASSTGPLSKTAYSTNTVFSAIVQ